MKRLADLPPEVSADPIYNQMKDLNQKITELRQTKVKLESQMSQENAKVVNQEGLRTRLKNAITRLETASPEEQRPIYANVLKFAELHPTRVKLGIYAPTQATGTDGTALRAGSSTVLVGARRGTRPTTVTRLRLAPCAGRPFARHAFRACPPHATCCACIVGALSFVRVPRPCNHKIQKAKPLRDSAFCILWCEEGDSNPHVFRHTPLKRTWLPITPSSRGRMACNIRRGGSRVKDFSKIRISREADLEFEPKSHSKCAFR